MYLHPHAGHGAGPEGSGRGAQGRDGRAPGPSTETWQPGKETLVCLGGGGTRRPFSKLEAEGLQPFIYTFKAKSSILLGLETLS